MFSIDLAMKLHILGNQPNPMSDEICIIFLKRSLSKAFIFANKMFFHSLVRTYEGLGGRMQVLSFQQTVTVIQN